MRTLAPSPFEQFSVAVLPDRQTVTVVPAGELDVASVDVLEREVRALLDAGFGDVVIDLRRLSFIGSAGLRLLLVLRTDARREGHALTLVSGSEDVQRLFAMTATRHLFDWHEE